jgi:hypothetical protein
MKGTLTVSSLTTVYQNNSSIHSIPIKHALHCQLLLPYDIYLLQMGFQLVAVVGKLVQKWERDSYIYKRRNNTQKYTKTQNTQNRKHTKKQKTKNIKKT